MFQVSFIDFKYILFIQFIDNNLKNASVNQKICYNTNSVKLLKCLDFMTQKISVEDVETIINESVSIMNDRHNNIINSLAYNNVNNSNNELEKHEIMKFENPTIVDNYNNSDTSSDDTNDGICVEIGDIGAKRKRLKH